MFKVYPNRIVDYDIEVSAMKDKVGKSWGVTVRYFRNIRGRIVFVTGLFLSILFLHYFCFRLRTQSES